MGISKEYHLFIFDKYHPVVNFGYLFAHGILELFYLFCGLSSDFQGFFVIFQEFAGRSSRSIGLFHNYSAETRLVQKGSPLAALLNCCVVE
jgi:hypothetical protein